MAIDPISLGLTAAGFIGNLLGKRKEEKTAREGIAAQQANLANALAAARGVGAERLTEARRGAADIRNLAGAVRTDVYGNRIFYDPTTNQWRTELSPDQQRIAAADQARQERALTRGAQASEDYQRQRAGYLYRQPPSEEATRAEILNLINQARGEGDRALSTLVGRQELRQRGNMPVINAGPLAGSDAGARLAQTMLQARTQALNETMSRRRAHAEEYLPSMKQFETTANYVPEEGPQVGRLSGLQSESVKNLIGAVGQGQQDVLGGYRDLMGAISQAYGSGAGGLASAYGTATKADTPIQMSQFASLIAALRPTAAQLKAEQLGGGTVGSTTGAKYAGDSTPALSWDRRFSFGPTTRGAGTEAAPFGGASLADLNFARQGLIEEPASFTERFGSPKEGNGYWYF